MKTNSQRGFIHLLALIIIIVIILYVFHLTPYELYLKIVELLKAFWHFIISFLKGEPFQGIGQKIKESQTLQ